MFVSSTTCLAARHAAKMFVFDSMFVFDNMLAFDIRSVLVINKYKDLNTHIYICV